LPAFYTDSPSKILRFGDVVTGFQAAALRMDSPNSSAKPLDLKIHLSQPKYFVVMTPCCSIEMQALSLAPLEELRNTFLSLPQLWDNLSSINAQMPAQDAVPPKKWEHLDATQRSAIMAKGTCYVLVELFVYEPHDLFETYTLKKGKDLSRDFRHRLVDFKKIFRVDCSQIDRNNDAPAGVKVLQLTDTVRAQLRDKLAYFFGRPPDEDVAALAAAQVEAK
jgi:hypothetical protein